MVVRVEHDGRARNVASDVTFDFVFGEDASDEGRAFPVWKAARKLTDSCSEGGRDEVGGEDGEARASHVSTDGRSDEGEEGGSELLDGFCF